MKEITVQATIEQVAKVTDFVNQILVANACSMKAQMQIDIAIDEVLSNIVYYSGSATMTVRCAIANGVAQIVFIDNGTPYNPLVKEDPDVSLPAEQRQLGGLGIYMVKKSMDEVIYTHQNTCNILTIKKAI